MGIYMVMFIYKFTTTNISENREILYGITGVNRPKKLGVLPVPK